MSYCLGIKVKDGLVGLADTRITSGNQTLMAKKVVIQQKKGKYAVFFMTSGLRALRDKAMIYFNEIVEESGFEYRKLHQLVNAFGSISPILGHAIFWISLPILFQAVALIHKTNATVRSWQNTWDDLAKIASSSVSQIQDMFATRFIFRK